MDIKDLSRGMIFRDNDKRMQGRMIIVIDVDRLNGVIFFSTFSSVEGAIEGLESRSRKPERFHLEEKSSGYTYAGKS